MSKSQLGRAPGGLFAPGNQAALKSGTQSLAIVKQRSEEVRAELTEHLNAHLPHLVPADQPMVELAVDVLTKLRLIQDYLDRTSGGSIIGRNGQIRPVFNAYDRMVSRAMTIFRELGIDPRARSEILASLGFAAESRTRMAQEATERLRSKVLDIEPEELPEHGD